MPDPLNILHLIRELGTEFGLGNVLENGTVVPPAPKIVKILKKMKERQKELLKVLQHLWDESDFVEELQSKISRMVADEQKRDSEHAQIRARITEMTRRQEESTRLRREVEELRKESDANVEKFKLTMLRLYVMFSILVSRRIG